MTLEILVGLYIFVGVVAYVIGYSWSVALFVGRGPFTRRWWERRRDPFKSWLVQVVDGRLIYRSSPFSEWSDEDKLAFIRWASATKSFRFEKYFLVKG